MSEDVASEALLEFLNAVEAGIASAKRRIKEAKGLTEKPAYDIEKIHWEPAQGDHGLYERSEDVNSLDFKGLLKDVQAHCGKMTVASWFVWAFQNGSTLGRKQKKAKA
jgi:hypothetical protein